MLLTSINYKSDFLKYQGRIDTNNSESAKFYWSGSSVKIKFIGTSLNAVVRDESGRNYFNIIVDEIKIHVRKFPTEKTKINLISDLPFGEHEIEIYKRTEWDMGPTYFYGFEFETETEILPVPNNTYKLEFYGDSLSAGLGVEDPLGMEIENIALTDQHKSYSSITARHFNADAHFIVRSGIGLMVSWSSYIMPEIWNRLNPENEKSLWNFSKFIPDIVVVNLFQNDSWLVKEREHEQYLERFGEVEPSASFIINSYKSFINKLRQAYPSANIICMLGSMDSTAKNSPWPGYIQTAVESLDDEKIFSLFVPYKEREGHPNEAEQKVIASYLIQFIKQNFNW